MDVTEAFDRIGFNAMTKKTTPAPHVKPIDSDQLFQVIKDVLVVPV